VHWEIGDTQYLGGVGARRCCVGYRCGSVRRGRPRQRARHTGRRDRAVLPLSKWVRGTKVPLTGFSANP